MNHRGTEHTEVAQRRACMPTFCAKPAELSGCNDQTPGSSRSCCTHQTAAMALPNRLRKGWRVSFPSIGRLLRLPSIQLPPIKTRQMEALLSVVLSFARPYLPNVDPDSSRCQSDHGSYGFHFDPGSCQCRSWFAPLLNSSFPLLVLKSIKTSKLARCPTHILVTMCEH